MGNGIKRIDSIILLVVLGLVFCGLIFILDVSGIYGGGKYFIRQLIWAIVGIFLMLGVARINYHFWNRFSFELILFTYFLLIFVLFLPPINGAHRWINLKAFSFQPSEFAKLVLIIYLAGALDRKKSKITDFRQGILPLLLISLFPIILVFLQPDFGNSVVLGLIFIFMLFLGGVRLKHIFFIIFASFSLAAGGIFSSSYRTQRISSFLNPWASAQEAGYQLVQALLALGSGGITGKGLGKSTQKLLYLPEAHTDFIFSIIGEEIGFIGVFLIIGAFFVLVIRGFKVAYRCEDFFGNLLASGISFLIGIEVILNLGVVSGLLPTKGLPLPFLSYGGSSLLITLLSCGILLNISKHQRGGD